MSHVGLAVGVGIDCRSAAYGQTWDLTLETHRLRLAHLLNRVLRPLVMHSGTPCTAFSILGKRNPQQADWDLLQFTIDVAIHQSFQGLLMSVENPTSSALWVQPRWLEHFGSRARPMLPRRFFVLFFFCL